MGVHSTPLEWARVKINMSMGILTLSKVFYAKSKLIYKYVEIESFLRINKRVLFSALSNLSVSFYCYDNHNILLLTIPCGKNISSVEKNQYGKM